MNAIEWAQIKYFKPHEFDSPDLPGSGEKMQFEFVRTLDHIREAVGFPLYIVSGVRTPAHNAEVGGVDSSAHENGWASDIALLGRTEGIVTLKRAQLTEAASHEGIRRIGFGKTFLHLDMDPSKPTPRYWLYD